MINLLVQIDPNSQSALGICKDLAAIILAIIGLLAFIKGIFEYVKQGKQKRSEQFIEMREKYVQNEKFKNFFELLEHDPNEKLERIGYKEKLEFLGFYEELALMVNSKLITSEIAYYMFGYYAIRCWETDSFWTVIDEDGNVARIQKDSQPWALFKHFALEMKAKQDNFEFKTRKLRF